MVDTLELERLIRESGKTKTFLANKMDKTIQTLNSKIKNRSEFKNDEVIILCREINVTTLEQMASIFFAPDVDKNLHA